MAKRKPIYDPKLGKSFVLNEYQLAFLSLIDEKGSLDTAVEAYVDTALIAKWKSESVWQLFESYAERKEKAGALNSDLCDSMLVDILHKRLEPSSEQEKALHLACRRLGLVDKNRVVVNVPGAKSVNLGEVSDEDLKAVLSLKKTEDAGQQPPK